MSLSSVELSEEAELERLPAELKRAEEGLNSRGGDDIGSSNWTTGSTRLRLPKGRPRASPPSDSVRAAIPRAASGHNAGSACCICVSFRVPHPATTSSGAGCSASVDSICPPTGEAFRRASAPCSATARIRCAPAPVKRSSRIPPHCARISRAKSSAAAAVQQRARNAAARATLRWWRRALRSEVRRNGEGDDLSRRSVGFNRATGTRHC